MTIDWASLGIVAIVTIVAAALVVGIYSLGIASLATGQERAGQGRASSSSRAIGYLCLGVSGLIVLFGLYLIIPQFH